MTLLVPLLQSLVVTALIASLTAGEQSYSSTYRMEKLLQKYEQSRDLNKDNYYCKGLGEDWRSVSEHPVAAYSFIKCLHNTEETFEEDLKGAALSLVRLQDVYDLSIPDLLNGTVADVASAAVLRGDDCVFIAQQAFFNLQLEAAERWLDHCRMEQGQAAGDTWVNDLRGHIALLKDLIASNGERSAEVLQDVLQMFPQFSRAALTLLTERKEILHMKSTLNTNAKLLCLGLKPPWDSDAGAKCEVKYSRESWYFPSLVETIHAKPKVLIFHRVISEREIETLKSAAAQKLELSKTHRYGDGKTEITSARIGQMAWISPEANSVVRNIYSQMETFTGLSAESAEDFQILNYGLGGHYEVHMDFFDSHRKGDVLPTGDRIATALFYLNNVDKGGATVFPELGLRVHPVRGSVLFWRNLLPDGSGDYRTLHAACPVITGTKWVANLWFHENGQQSIIE